MSDITMCTNEDCPLKESCYRKTAPINTEWQSYQLFEPNKIDTNTFCDFYIDKNEKE